MTAGETPKPRRRRWWHHALTYPSLVAAAAALVGAVPKYYEWVEAYRLDVPANAVQQAIEQRDLWGKNAGCLTQVSPVPASTETDYEVAMWACPSGDVLVRVTGPDERESYRWVGLDTFRAADASGFAILGSAHAAEHEPGQPMKGHRTVQCQGMDGEGKIVFVYAMPSGMCMEEIVNPFTGNVESRRPVKCDTSCAPAE